MLWVFASTYVILIILGIVYQGRDVAFIMYPDGSVTVDYEGYVDNPIMLDFNNTNIVQNFIKEKNIEANKRGEYHVRSRELYRRLKTNDSRIHTF